MYPPGTTTSVGPAVNNSTYNKTTNSFQPNTPAQTASNTATAALQGNTADYNDIMSRYKQLYQNAGNANLGSTLNYNVNIPTYQTSQDYHNAIGNLQGLASNGGYSPQNIADLRARGVAPIRAAYGNAQNDIARQKVLQGGYSPNFTAASAKMAREMSSQMADQVTNVNAGIAQNQAQNELAAATPLASVTAGEQANRNQFDLETANMQNQFGLNKLNAQMQLAEFPYQVQLGALGGMTGAYSATPGLANMTGNQALNIAELQNQMKQQGFNNNLALLGAGGGGQGGAIQR